MFKSDGNVIHFAAPKGRIYRPAPFPSFILRPDWVPGRLKM